MDKIKVLYIDDEKENLNAFKASFRRIFDVHVGISADEGLEILKKEAIEVVISDQRMPGKSGTDFFESISILHPNPIRILLTGYSDITAVIEAVNKGNIYRYVSKPWNEYDLKLTIENAYQLYTLKEQNNKLTEKYKKVFMNSSDPIILFDSKGGIIDYNKSATNLFKGKEGKIGMLQVNSLFKNQDDVTRMFYLLDKKGSIEGFECLIYGSEKIITCLFSVNKINNNSGETITYQAIIKDITERVRVSQLLIKKVIETQEQERARIARELHDGIGQSLVAISFHTKSIKMKVDKNKSFSEELEILPKLIAGAMNDLTQICSNILPVPLQNQNLITAIEELSNNTTTNEFKIKFTYQNKFPKVNDSLALSIFRIVQEFINNSIKHSQSTIVKVDLNYSSASITLSLNDNGIGFNINQLEISNGRGLKNIKTRIEALNGKINFSSIANQGTEFDIAIPILLTDKKASNQFISLA